MLLMKGSAATETMMNPLNLGSMGGGVRGVGERLALAMDVLVSWYPLYCHKLV